MHKYFVKLPCVLRGYLSENWEYKEIDCKFKYLNLHVTAKNKQSAFDMSHDFVCLFGEFVDGEFELKLYSGEKVDYSITNKQYKVFIDEKSFTTTERDSEENE